MRVRRRIEFAIATAALAIGVALPYGAARYAEQRLQRGPVDRLASALGEPVSIDSVQVGPTGEFTIHGLRIGDLVALDRLEVRLDLESALSGRAEVREVRAMGAHLNARVQADGDSDLARLARRVRQLRDMQRAGLDEQEQEAQPTIAFSLAGGSLAADVEDFGQVQISQISARTMLGQPSVRVSAGRIHLDGARASLALRGDIERVAADFDMRERRLQRLVSVTGNLALTSATGETTRLSDVSITRGLGASLGAAWAGPESSAEAMTAQRDERAPDVRDDEIVRLDARVLDPAGGRPARVSLTLSGSGRLERMELHGQALPLTVLQAWSPRSLNLSHTRFTGRAIIERSATAARLEADGAVHGLTVDDARVAREAVTLDGDVHARVSASLAGQYDSPAQQVRIALEEVFWDTAGLRLELSGEVGYDRPAFSDHAGLAARPTWLPDTASLSLVIPTTQCAAALGAMPPVFRRHLVGLDLSGSVSARAAIEFRRATVKDTRLELDVNADGCGVLRDAVAADPRGIARHPDTADTANAYATLDRLRVHTQRAFVTMEDARFFRHHGFDRAQIERSLAVDLNAAAFVRGGSTITQQLVKNAFLSHERTLARKFQEAVLTWRVEAVADKSQILERYLNIIELGPDTRGIEAAARYWFGKQAHELGVRESAFLAALTPAPKTTSRRILEHGGIDPVTDERIDQVLEVMRKHDVISERIYHKALRFPLALVAPMTPVPATSASSPAGSRGPLAPGRLGSNAQEQAVAEVSLEL